MAPPHEQLSTRRRGKELSTGGKGMLRVLGGVGALVFFICIFRLTLLLIATSSSWVQDGGVLHKHHKLYEPPNGSGEKLLDILDIEAEQRKPPPKPVTHEADRILEAPKGELSVLDILDVEADQRKPPPKPVTHEADRIQLPIIHEAPKVEEAAPVINSTAHQTRRVLFDNGPYHSRKVFFQDYQEMAKKLKVFIYPWSKQDRFKHIFLPANWEPGGNYASEAYFKKALVRSGMVTKNPAEADFFFMPFSITQMRNDPHVGVGRIQGFVEDYMKKIVHEWPYWNRSGGADHFYVACHSVAKSAMDRVEFAQMNAIQVVCSSNYHVRGYIPHKDVPMPQVWPRQEEHPDVKSTSQRSTLAFYAGKANSPVRAKVVQVWKEDPAVKVYGSRISTSYSQALLRSKFCLHIKGYEVNTARLADALFHGCVPVVIANYYELPFDSVLNWSKFSVVVTTNDIPRLKEILSQISNREYKKMHSLVLEARRHFQWHSSPQECDAFFMVMYQLWRRRHILRYTLQ